MKYARLSKEQFEELHEEFARFLATQQITADEWKELKTHKPEVAEEELDLFSDLVWERVLQNASYLEHFSPNQLHLFKLEDEKMSLIALKVNRDGVDITTKEGYAWLQENLHEEDVVFYTSAKAYSDNAYADIFDLIKKGAVITKGALFLWFEKFVDVK